MQDTGYKAVAIVGAGAILPDAPSVPAFWENVMGGRYSISEVPPERWDPKLYYDPDHSAPDKTYSKIGGWVREFPWDPMKWKLPIPPRVAAAMDDSQKWGIACTREALADYGYPERPLNLDQTAVILGNALGGEKHYLTAMRAFFPEFAQELEQSEAFASLPESLRRDIEREWTARVGRRLPPITEDTMPGELANCLAGRIANVFNFKGPNFVCDAACASAMAAMRAAMEGLIAHDFDVALTGGIDRNMGVSSFIKFCKIGALSGTGSRPYAEGADGFVMGEGAAVLLMKRLEDAERDGDRIYAVLRGVGASSDGKGKGITAPNPAGQKICVERAWKNVGLSPLTATMMEGHGTSTSVGDVVEFESITAVLKAHGTNGHSIALGSVKSNIGHLKGAAGAAGVLKVSLALRDKMLPPSVHCERPNSNMDFANSPLRVNTAARPWTETVDGVRRAGVSAFGFGGTNFHMILEEYVPRRLNGNGKKSALVEQQPPSPSAESSSTSTANSQAPESSSKSRDSSAAEYSPASARTAPIAATAALKAPLRGALVIGADSSAGLAARLQLIQKEAQAGYAPAPSAPAAADLHAPERLAIDFGNAAELAHKCARALKALDASDPAIWRALRAFGIYRGQGAAPKVAFLYTGQGSQYPNMLRNLRDVEPIVERTFEEADRIMQPILGKPLSDYVFVDANDQTAVEQADADLRQTAITQPAVLTVDLAFTRLLEAYGIRPDMTMGHSLGEYGALIASGALPFEDALEAVAARGREMTRFATVDNGRMAAVFAPLGEIERILKSVDGYVVIANLNSERQAVIGGASGAVEQAIAALQTAGYDVVPLPVSHAFHTSIVAPASEPLREVLDRLRLQPPKIPIVANVDGEFYPTGPDARPAMLDILAKQVAAPVQFIKGLKTLYESGARVFVETGPKKALFGFAEEGLGNRGDVVALFTNHPKFEDLVAFNQALCGLYAAGLGASIAEPRARTGEPSEPRKAAQPVVITGASLGLPGKGRIFDDANIARMLNGEQRIERIPAPLREAMLEKHITRLVKNDNGGPSFEEIEDVAGLVKLAGRGGQFDLQAEYGIQPERVEALDRTTQLAIAAGIDALRDAGIPLTLHYKITSKGTRLPERWGLPDALRDSTGVIFASAFPGCDSFADEAERFYSDRARRQQLASLEELLEKFTSSDSRQEIERRTAELKSAIQKNPYHFDRRFIFRVLPMGHSQFAELIGARGPNTQVNAACASTAQAIGLAQDWIRAGRCGRVVVVSADDVTSDHLLGWFGSAFLATGAAATEDNVEEVALPFDRRRHGMVVGMGAAALVVESAAAAAERGLRPICEVLSAVSANSAFHGTRLDPAHICQVMEELIGKAETQAGIRRQDIAGSMVFVSHETYTPARGGSAQAEIQALRRVFGKAADQIVIANTKGFTGHAMAAGLEDVVAVKALETGIVPPVANFKEIDPELGPLNLSRGGEYPVEYALRLGAGFGSQIAMTLLRRTGPDGPRPNPNQLGYGYRIDDRTAWQAWLERIAEQPAELEVAHRTLRLRQAAAPATTPQPSLKEEARVQPEALAESPAPALTPQSATPEPVISKPNATEPITPEIATTVPTQAAIRDRVLELVVEKTGYAREMLDMDLDLEADLGIDTVKQAELIAAIREVYGIARDPNFSLRDVPTLTRVVQFVSDRIPRASAAAPAVAPPESVTQMVAQSPAPPPADQTAPVQEPEAPPTVLPVDAIPAGAAGRVPTADSVTQTVLEIVAEKTGYPKEMLDLDLDLEADLGIDTVKQAEVFATIRESYGIARDPNLRLRDVATLNRLVRFVCERLPQAAEPEPAPAPAPPKALAAAAGAAEVVASTAAAVAAPESASEMRPAAEIPAEDAIRQRVLDLVVEKTGYPKEMLDLDLDLEADLGIDTVKQAELFASIREFYSIPRDATVKLREFSTLARVIQFVVDRLPQAQQDEDAAPAPTPQSAEQAPAAALPPEGAQSEEAVRENILDLVVEKTGYPKEMLDLDLDLEADLGIDTVKQAELFAGIREFYNIPRDATIKLREFSTLARVIQFVLDRRPDLKAASAHTEAVTQTPPEPSPPAVEAAEVAAVASAADDEPILEKVLALAAEKTGYPQEMLDLDLDLEADLGIDTVKQAELFASVRAAFDIPREQALRLRDFPTLGHIIRFAQERRGAAAGEVTPQAAPVEAPRPAPPANFEACDRIPRRVPVPKLRLPLGLCKKTGVTLASGSRVLIAPDRGGVAGLLSQKLRERDVEVAMLSDAPVQGRVDGVYWLPALDFEGDLKSLSPAQWREAIDIRATALYRAMRSLYRQIASPANFLISATRLGGRHGYDDQGAEWPMGGAVTGFVKAYKRERPEALVKALDFDGAQNPAEIAGLLIEEALADPGAIEIGYAEARRWTVELEPQPFQTPQSPFALDSETVFAVTGAAGSIVSAITADLAAASGGTFYLLDRVPEPDPANSDLQQFVSDRDGLKKTLFARIQARGERATPAMVERELAALERGQAALSVIEAVRKAGGTALFYSVDLTDANAVAEVIGEIRRRSGRIDVLLHAAGMERSHFLPDKEPGEFNLVFDVKADGFFHLLRAIGELPLGAVVAFSSIAGRFGNAGQADYSSANDLLCKIASSFRRTRPKTRFLALDWTAWSGIGMAARGSIPKMMASAGIEMLPPEAGIPWIRRELITGGRSREVVVAGSLGILEQQLDADGGYDASALPRGVMTGGTAHLDPAGRLTVETALDPARQPFLYDHVIEGTPVLPGVMGLEAFAEAALALAPGWRIDAIENVDLTAPFKFYRNEQRSVKVQAEIQAEREGLAAVCAITGERMLPLQAQPQVTTHFTGRVRLSPKPPEPGPARLPVWPEGTLVEAAEIYEVYFHGPAYRVLNQAWWDERRIMGEMATALPQDHYPADQPLVMAPRLIELCFQTAGIWEMAVQRRMGLPHRLESVRLYRAPEHADGPLYAVVTANPDSVSFDAEVIDSAGACFLQMRGYRTATLRADIEARLFRPAAAAMA